MSLIYIVVFLTIASATYLGTHYFVYRSVVAGFGVKRNSRAARTIRISFLAAGLLFIAGEFISRTPAAIYLKTAIIAGGLWIGCLTMAFFFFLMRAAVLLFLKSDGFKYYSAAATVFLSVGLGVFGAINASGPPIMREITVETDKLSDGKSFKIVQISDLHLNYAKTDAWLASVRDKINLTGPDAVVITGDIIDARLRGFNNFCEILGGIESKYGVFAITGNHEYYVGLEKFEALAAAAGIKILYNKNISVGKSVAIIGMNDDEGAGMASGGPDFAGAAKGVDFSKFVVLLYHRPTGFAAHSDAGVDLQLSGHTHAGQIPPADIMVRLIYKYPYGLYRRGVSNIYTTSGTGTWGPPMRIFSKSEIVAITIKGNSGANSK
ncbi:MAG: metallophosphoesterase [Endomicrobiia bacterium]|nr:metallophosphoesterase [Endomicrobiia bacterium]